MAYQNKNKTRSPREEPALQLSSYQLVMAICSLLLVGCLLFVAGIMVNRYTGGTNQTQVSALDNTPPVNVPSAGTQPARSGERTEGVQVAPKPVTLPPEPSAGASIPSTTKPPVVRDTSSKYIPAPPPRRSTGTEPSGTPTPTADTAAKPAAGQPASAQAPVQPVITPVVTEPATPSAGQETPSPAASVQAGGEMPPAGAGESPAPAAETAPETTPTTPQGNPSAAPQAPFTIQVASFDADNLDRAKQFKKAIEDKTDYTVDLVPAKDGKRVRAFVGSYPDRAAADKARAALAKIKDFEGCFVKSLAE
ncbi:MAG: SPOR domain-containing protein [Candidatus Hydrogenedentes bacterium]|nr:SPOR domain-containing protein [Candidatus Hydrogenedentota bacterium]